ncbi:hypothetical protein QF024_001423 [Chryseobacterium nepalense]|nr:hypothetical protein [Chryseobacterium nepalense]
MIKMDYLLKNGKIVPQKFVGLNFYSTFVETITSL